MLGATQAVLLGAAGCPTIDYAATVTEIPDLLAYWRFSDADGSCDSAPGCRHGTYSSTVSLVAGLPTGSNSATHLPGNADGTVPHDAGLELPTFTCLLRRGPINDRFTQIGHSLPPSGGCRGPYAKLVRCNEGIWHLR